MQLTREGRGHPELVEAKVKETEKLFQGFAKSTPNKDEAYQAARCFLRGEKLSEWQRDLVACVAAEPIREHMGATVLGHKAFGSLLQVYENEARSGELWRLTWHGLLSSYFAFDPTLKSNAMAGPGHEQLRSFLQRTWPLIDNQVGKSAVPDWITVLRRESEVLSAKPADKYAIAYLSGDPEPANRIASDLGIEQSSWFWHSLVLGAVRAAESKNDPEFISLIPRLLQIVQGKPAFRDTALEILLIRYHKCKGVGHHEQLRDYVVQPGVWKNPKLKSAGMATSWNRVPEPVWQMVLNWVNECNLRDFFAILAARNQADSGRLAFWSRYMKQITWTRLVFGSKTMELKSHNEGVRNLIAREADAFAELTSNTGVDAFMMRIGSHIFVEFSLTGNAAYAYSASDMPFNEYEKFYAGDTTDLKIGRYGDEKFRFLHQPGWQDGATEKLKSLGITPDRPTATRAPSAAGVRHNTTPQSTTTSSRRAPSVPDLQSLVSRYLYAYVNDKRHEIGGRLYVVDPKRREALGAELKPLGFVWSVRTNCWYFSEN
jgi:hypothetical protein